MTKRSSFQNWFYRNWKLLTISGFGTVRFTWDDFQLHLEEAYNAGANAEIRRRKLADSFNRAAEATE